MSVFPFPEDVLIQLRLSGVRTCSDLVVSHVVTVLKDSPCAMHCYDSACSSFSPSLSCFFFRLIELN